MKTRTAEQEQQNQSSSSSQNSINVDAISARINFNNNSIFYKRCDDSVFWLCRALNIRIRLKQILEISFEASHES